MKVKKRLLRDISSFLGDMMCDYDEGSYDYNTAESLQDEVLEVLRKAEQEKLSQ